MNWQPTVNGPAATARRDQFLAELADVTRDAQLVFVVAAPRAGEPLVLVRGLCGVPDDDPDLRDQVAAFLFTARRELDEMFEQLEAAA